jgi:hypothetical protein
VGLSRTLRQLLRIRNLEEEQGKARLESAVGELHRLERAQAATRIRGTQGRRLVERGILNGQLNDRLAGQLEAVTAERRTIALGERIATTEDTVAARREEFLALRVNRRQVETLIEAAQRKEDSESGRREQQSIDDWYGARRARSESDTAEKRGPAGSGSVGSGGT